MEHPRATMTPKERVMIALEGETPDRIPVINPTSVATVESMEVTGAYFPDVHLDAGKMAALAAAGHEVLGFDSVTAYFSVHQEAAAFGCEMNWGSIDTMPDIKENPYQTPEEFDIPGDFLTRPATATVIESIRLLKKKYGERVCVIGKVMGPWTLSYHLYGVQNLLMDTLLDPDKVNRFLHKLKHVPVMFANAQFQAGADLVTLADHATGDLVGPDVYRDFLLPIHREATQAIHGPLVLHICGRTTDRMSDIAKAGFSAFHFDSKNNTEEATTLARQLGLKLVGNINNPDVLYAGTPEDVRTRVFEAVQAGVQFLGPECAVPLRTPNANLKAIVEAVSGRW